MGSMAAIEIINIIGNEREEVLRVVLIDSTDSEGFSTF